MDGVKKCCEREEIKSVFILFGDVCSICRIVEELKAHGKVAMVHMDLDSGLSGKEVAVTLLKRIPGRTGSFPQNLPSSSGPGSWISIRPSGCSSWIPWPLKILKNRWDLQGPDSIVILPGLMPKVIRRVARLVKAPVIAGGLISEKEDVMAALSAGAISVSSTNQSVWSV